VSARATLLTLLGEVVLPRRDTGAWTQSLVSALETTGVEEKNARQALARLGDRGVLTGDRIGRRVRWRLTPHGVELLSTGAERIYGFGGADEHWDGQWLVVLCPVPEEQRGKRQQLRTRLAFAGFGFLPGGAAVCPHLDRERVAHDVLKDLGLVDLAVVLRAAPSDLVPSAELVQRAWDLDELAASYRHFIAAFDRRSPRTPVATLAATIELVDAWRRFPFVDPELPDEVLPRRWPAPRAKHLFDTRRAQWTPVARAYFDELDASPPRLAHIVV
jgi:phenylacetic acid degradation operon negative regulatory protein